MHKLIIYDFDGVMTNNKVLVDQDGKESVICNRDDGWAVRKIKEMGIDQTILSSETNRVVLKRSIKLGIPAFTGKLDKLKVLKYLLREFTCKAEEVIYVGNGLNDIEIMKAVGLSFCPADAHPLVKEIAMVVLKTKGGDGVLLEFLDCLERINNE